MIDLRTAQLESFLVLAEELHFGRAAARLGIAQSALSAQVQRLEAALDATLLVRTSRRVALTPAGEQVRSGAARVLDDLGRLAHSAEAAAAGRLGVVRVSGTQGAMLGLVPRTVRRLRDEVPDLAVEVDQLPTQLQLDAVAGGRVDVAFVRSAGTPDGLRVETVHVDPVEAVLPAHHPLADRDVLPLAALADEPFVLWERRGAPAVHDEIVAACRAAGFAPRVAYEAQGSVGRQAFVAAGLGVALESAANRCVAHRGVRFVPLEGAPPAARIDAVWRQGPDDPRVGHVLAAAREEGRTLL